jgi:hypothetical protein
MARSITLHWHQYILDHATLPHDLYLELQAKVYSNTGVLWDQVYNFNIIVSIYDDDPWITHFNLKYQEYILECTKHEKTYEWG